MDLGPSLFTVPSPPDLTPCIVKNDDQYSAGGSFGDVYRRKCKLDSSEKEVAVKAFRFKLTMAEKDGDNKAGKMIRRELGIWKRLEHKNIVPFLGIAYGFGICGTMSLVSLWMSKGTLKDFLAEHDATLTLERRLQLLLDIANGLDYLHSFSLCPIIHGDLSSTNILLDVDDTARLTDFGYASLIGDVPEALAYLQMSTTRPGATRWTAPEKVLEDAKTTTKSDIYSFGCISLQEGSWYMKQLVLSGKMPWSEVEKDTRVIMLLAQGRQPGRPDSRAIIDQHWDLIQQCWSSVQERPPAKSIITRIQAFSRDLQTQSFLKTSQLTQTLIFTLPPPEVPIVGTKRRMEPQLSEQSPDAKRQKFATDPISSSSACPPLTPAHISHNRNVLDLREEIEGHSGSAMPTAEQEPQILTLSADYVSPTNSPQTPTLSISSTDDERPSTYPLRTSPGRYPDSDRLPVMQELSPDSPLERSEYLLPPAPYSSPPVNHSLESWQSNHSLQRPHTSHFSRFHHTPINYEEEFLDTVSSAFLLPSTPTVDQYIWPLLDDHQNASLDYFMKYVLRAQYFHASDSLDSIIWRLIHTSDNARHAACLLSDLHRKSTQKNRPFAMELEDVEALRRMQMVSFNAPLTEGDAFACLCLVFYFCYRGGKGQWQTFLDTACNYSLSILNDSRWGGPRGVLLVYSESLRFIIKTSIWFDVLASVTLVREPRFLGVIRDLYDRQPTFFDDEPTLPMAEYSMMSVMGCENHIVLALAEIASLASWKDARVKAGSLSVDELVRRGHAIEEVLKKPSAYPSESEATLDSERQRIQQGRLTSEVFRASASVYLHSVVVGDFPRCPEIIEGVNDTIMRLRAAGGGSTGRAVVRNVVFSICVCGCLTEDPHHQNYFLGRLQGQQGQSIGNSQQVSYLIQEVWKRRHRGEAVDWRQVMREAEMLLV